MVVLNGVPAAPGMGLGRAVLLPAGLRTAPPREAKDPAAEETQLRAAVAAAKRQLEQLLRETEGLKPEDRELLAIQKEMLSDPAFTEDLIPRLRSENLTAAYAVWEQTWTLRRELEELDDPYLAARGADVAEVGGRLLDALQGTDAMALRLTGPSVVLAEELAPAALLALPLDKVKGLAVRTGGGTGHAAILARSLGIPYVTGCAIETVPAGEWVLVDGDGGRLILSPDPAAQAQALQAAEEPAPRRVAYPDGRPLAVAANVGSLQEAELAKEAGAEGIGLFRTELLFLSRDTAPSEEEQYRIYRRTAELFPGLPVILRTLDAGGDKDAPCLDLPKERNPFLGLRGIRLCLAREQLFRTQLRAMLRAAAWGDIRILLPMVSSLEELRRARVLLTQCARELRAENCPHRADVPLGVMVEVPAVAILAEEFAGEADFFSIGTNDLTQYTLACERGNPALADCADPLHPALRALIRRTVQAAQGAGIPCGICGELAADPEGLAFLYTLRPEELSVGARLVGKTRARLRDLGAAVLDEARKRSLNT